MSHTNPPKQYRLNSTNTKIHFKVSTDHPFQGVSIPSSRVIPSEKIDEMPVVTILIKLHEGSEMKETVRLNTSSETSKISDFINSKLSDQISSIFLEVENYIDENVEIQIDFNSGNSFISVSNPEREFSDHLANPLNSKILFSAPFGHGKTTFLNYYFEKHNSRYELFRVFPVNYSISNNNDIFRYIKADILFQLLGKDVEFEFSEITKTQAFEEYIYLNPLKTIGLLVKTVLSLNKTTEKLPGVIDKFEAFFAKIEEYKTKNGINDKQETLNYIEELYQNEGSIFEDNFYTQLIRQLIQQLSDRSSKQNVLIIEDLDRMDPDHIFRILNVISAHYDTYHLGTDFQYNNKFGFDKIIIVCDYNNIKKIFEHRYGKKTDFNGYFDKYFSSKPFPYDNTSMLKAASYDLLKNNHSKNIGNSLEFDFYLEFTNLLVASKLLSLREIFRVKSHIFARLSSPVKLAQRVTDIPSFQMILNLIEVFHITILEDKLVQLKTTEIKSNKFNWHHWSSQLLPIFGELKRDSNPEVYEISDVNNPLHGKQYVTAYSRNTHEYVNQVTDYDGVTVNLDKNDFISLLSYALDKFIKSLEH